MAQERYWAELVTNNVCFNKVWSDDPSFIPDETWVEYTPSEELSEIIGLQYQDDGTWAEPINE